MDLRLGQTFDTPWGAVRYDVAGSGPPLVLVHGTPWSAFNWRHLIPALAEWYTVYYYDLLGYGQSEKRDAQDVSLGVQNMDSDRQGPPPAAGHRARHAGARAGCRSSGSGRSTRAGSDAPAQVFRHDGRVRSAGNKERRP